MTGTLFVVATPIGNLEDLTFRALRTLKEVDVIAAEDTRRTSKLLAHYEIRKPLVSLREHNEVRETPRLIARLQRGECIALVTDAGTPGIADPGARLVRAVHEAGLQVVPIPGASAVTAALSVSGFPETGFTFMGFPPRSGAERERWFTRLSETPGIAVLFEAPHRIVFTFGDIANYCSGRRVVVCREITKFNESIEIIGQIEAGSAIQIDQRAQGEFVVVVGPASDLASSDNQLDEAIDLFGRITELAGVEERMAVSMVSSTLGVESFKVKNAIKKRRILVKQQNKPTA